MAVIFVVAAAYFLAARLSLFLLAEPDGVAVFWPAAGVASGILIGAGSAARWPVVIGVVAATLVANLSGDRNLSSSIFFAFANAIEAVIIAALVEHFHGSRFELDRLQRVIGLFAATIAATALSGFVGTLGFVLFHTSNASIPTIWLHWFTSDALGAVTVAPLAIGVASLIRDFPPRREVTEGGVALTLAAMLCAGMVFLPNQPWTFELAIATLSPLVVWIAARLRPAFTAAATFMCAITIVWTTTFAVGVFGDPRLPVEERILSAQATILAASFGALVLAALFSERRLHETSILERELRLQEALRAGGVMTFDWNVAAGEVRYSSNAEQILGVLSRQSLDSSVWLEQIHPDDRPRMIECADGARPDAPSLAVTFRYRRPDGAGEVWLEQIAVAQFNAAGKLAHIHGLAADITARKRSEQEISFARKSAELADRAKSSFLAAASHDLRQPLQTLRFLQGLLEQHHSNGEGRKLVTDMGRSLDTMSSMLSSLLDVNQLESGSVRPSLSEFTLNDIFDSIAVDFARSVEEKGLRWCLVRSGAMVRSDKRMLEEMLRNLLSNATRYTDAGRILLGCRRSGDNIRIEVWDSGVGIGPDQLPDIFAEYYQGAEGLQRGGFGLGLAIVRRLATLLDHRIHVSSTVGKGTRFSIEVPRVQARSDVPEVPRSAANEVDLLPAREVLIIEDETSVRTAVARFLKAKGIEAVVTATGDEALTLVNSESVRPDLVLSDYNLRGSIDGVESIGALRAALGWNVPAIIMTGDMRSETVEAIIAQDISVLIKPFQAAELLHHMTQIPSGTTKAIGRFSEARTMSAHDKLGAVHRCRR
ncbi:ATP-binding protein [Bradyrhizobium sp. USDA 4474]